MTETEMQAAESDQGTEATPAPAWRNIGLDFIRVTEAAAMAAARWVGSGKYLEAHKAATEAMTRALNDLDIDGVIVIGEEGRIGADSPLATGKRVGTGQGPKLDIVVDPIDGTSLVIKGHSGAISVVGGAPRGTMWSPNPAVYMDKIVVGPDAAKALVPEVMDAPAAWTLALIARVKKKPVHDLDVIVLDKPRHADLIEELRATGAHVWLRSAGDVEGAVLAALEDGPADVLMGVGGTSEGVIAACAVRAIQGQMLARLTPQSEAEKEAVLAAGLDLKRIWRVEDMVASERVFFAATGITRSGFLHEVDVRGGRVALHSMLLRGETGTRRMVTTEHRTPPS